MKKWLALQLLVFTLTLSSPAQTKTPSQSGLIVVTHVNVIDMIGARPKADMTVVITGDRITSVQKAGKGRIPAGARAIDGHGKYLIPGLWDMHVHWYDDRLLSLFIANGVTGVRQMFGSPLHLEWRKRIEHGEMLGPRQFVASPIVDGPNPVWPGSIMVGNAEDGRSAVRSIKEQGYDFVKVYTRLPRNAYFAIADEAKKQGITFGGHVPEVVSVAEASNSGQKSIEHLTNLSLSSSSVEADLRREMAELLTGPDTTGAWRRFDQKVLDTYDAKTARSLYALLAENRHGNARRRRCSLTSSLDDALSNDARLRYIPHSVKTLWDPANDFRLKTRTAADWDLSKRTYRRSFEMVRPMRRSGVRFLAGTDALNPFCFPGFSLHDELALLVEAGLTPFEALQAATVNPAIFMGKSDSLGSIEQGKIADLVLLDANPLSSIANTRQISAVIFGGRLFDRKQLDTMLEDAERLGSIKSIAATLSQIIEKENVESSVRTYRELKAKQPEAYDFGEEELNTRLSTDRGEEVQRGDRDPQAERRGLP
jgi:imidazolonepropionase-like amidohydrolase